MTAPGFTFRLAQPSDAEALTRFAREIFIETFLPGNNPDDLMGYVDGAFTPEMQRSEITRPGTFTVLAVDESDGIAGYAFVAEGAPRDVYVEEDPIEIKRFYIGASHHGTGLAKDLMYDVFERARQRGARTIWLGVWEANARAIAFYHKRGFVQAGTQRFLLGGDLQTDWVMQNTIALR